MKAYHLNHWLLSLHEFKYLHYSVTLLSRGWNYFFGVYSDLDLRLCLVKGFFSSWLLVCWSLNLGCCPLAVGCLHIGMLAVILLPVSRLALRCWLQKNDDDTVVTKSWLIPVLILV